MKSFVFLLLVALAAFTVQEWSQLIEADSADGNIYSTDMVIDSQGVTHVVYIRSQYNLAAYVKLGRQGEIITKYDFHIAGIDQLTIQSNEPSLYVVIESANQLYYVESPDNGKTWGSPRPIFLDSYLRQSPQLLFVKKTGRLFLFYKRTVGDSWVIGYISRPAGSSIFSEEKVVGHSTTASFAIQYSAPKGILHLFMVTGAPNSALIEYTKTTDNGLSWTPLTEITKRTVDTSIGLTAVAASDELPGYVYLLYSAQTYDTDPRSMQIKFTTDDGKTWSDRYETDIPVATVRSSREKPAGAAIVKKDSGEVKMLTMIKTGLATWVYSHWDLPGLKRKDFDTPFGGKWGTGCTLVGTFVYHGDMKFVTVIGNISGNNGKLHYAADSMAAAYFQKKKNVDTA